MTIEQPNDLPRRDPPNYKEADALQFERHARVGGATGSDIVRLIAAILLPPLGVFLQVGITRQFWINLLLTLVGYVPGIIHAVWIIARR